MHQGSAPRFGVRDGQPDHEGGLFKGRRDAKRFEKAALNMCLLEHSDSTVFYAMLTKSEERGFLSILIIGSACLLL
jgi:hypothetical protein